MSFGWTENRPNMDTSRRAWEKSWEDDFTRNFGVLSKLNGSFLSLLPAELVTDYASDEHLVQLEHETALLCELQQDLARAAATAFAEDAFEERWTALTPARREEVVLEGLVRTMRIPDMEDRRQWCPDTALSHLTARNGAEYIRMLKCLLPDTLETKITAPRHVPHPVVDRLFTPTAAEARSPGTKTVFRTFKISRTYALTLVIWNIFLAFTGREETAVPIKQQRTPTQPLADAEQRQTQRTIAKQAHEQRKGLEYACRACGRVESLLPAGTKLMGCSTCRKIGRTVFYCSRECQTTDWKAGVPRPHKLICGRPLDEDADADAAQRAPDVQPDAAAAWLPRPDPGFRRSPALLHQLSLLAQAEIADYVLVYPHPHPDQGVGIGPSFMQDKIAFTVQRNRAFRTGAPAAVHALYALLAPHLDRQGLPRAMLRAQLAAEFGVRVDDGAVHDDAVRGGGAPPTEAELRFAEESVRSQLLRKMMAF